VDFTKNIIVGFFLLSLSCWGFDYTNCPRPYSAFRLKLHYDDQFENLEDWTDSVDTNFGGVSNALVTLSGNYTSTSGDVVNLQSSYSSTSGDVISLQGYLETNACFTVRPPSNVFTDVWLKASTNNFADYWIIISTDNTTTSLTGVSVYYTDSGAANKLVWNSHTLTMGGNSIQDDLTDGNSCVGGITMYIGDSHGISCLNNPTDSNLRWSLYWVNNASKWQDASSRTVAQPIVPKWSVK